MTCEAVCCETGVFGRANDPRTQVACAAEPRSRPTIGVPSDVSIAISSGRRPESIDAVFVEAMEAILAKESIRRAQTEAAANTCSTAFVTNVEAEAMRR